MTKGQPLIDVRNLSVAFGEGADTKRVVDEVSFTVGNGETVALVGESGSGKTVSAMSILRLLPNSASHPTGEILFEGKDILKANEAQLRAILFGSGEYFQKSGGTTDGFLAALFRDALHRTVDAAGRASFAAAIAGGMSREGAALAVLSSAEAKELKVVSWYDTYLKRTADASGLSYFFNSLAKGQPDESVLATLLASPEYFQRT